MSATTYRLPDGREFKLNSKEWYLASCDKCGWVGSSEECGTDYCGGDDTDVHCPKCGIAGADCGKVADTAVELAEQQP